MITKNPEYAGNESRAGAVREADAGLAPTEAERRREAAEQSYAS